VVLIFIFIYLLSI